MGKKPILSISILISDRMDTIRRCLDSLENLRKQLPCELILVDTSKNPKIHEILLEYTDKVVEFEWCNDFSKARNTGLFLAKGEWFLFLDDDEWFANEAPIVEFFQSGEYKKYGCANYLVRNFYDKSYTHYSDSWASRMIRLDKDTHFESKIHEYLYPIDGKCAHVHALVNHSGYIYQTAADKVKHFERNSKLLLDMIEEEPEKLRWRVHLVQEYRSVKYWKQLYQFSIDCLKETKHLDNYYDNRDIGTFYAGAMTGAYFLKNYKDGLAIGEEGLADKRCSQLCHAYLYQFFAMNYYQLEQYEKAENAIQDYLKIRNRLEKDSEELEAQMGALLVGEAVDAIPLKRAYSILSGCALKRGDTSVLAKYLPLLEWDQKAAYLYKGLLITLVEAMAKNPCDPVYIEAATLAWKNKELMEEMKKEISIWQKLDMKAFLQILRVLAQVKGSHWYLWFAKIETKADVEEEFLALSFDEWAESLNEYLSNANLEQLCKAEHFFNDLQTTDDVRYTYTLMRIAEMKVLFSLSKESYEKKQAWFADFGVCVGAYAHTYYQEDIIENYPELLPPYIQAGLLFEKAFCNETITTKEILAFLKEAVAIYPILAEPVRKYMIAFSDWQEQQERTQKDEMRRLEDNIKKEVFYCVEQKRYEEAIQILKELKKMRPNDLEIVELILQIRLATL